MFRFIKPNKDFLTQNHNITIDLILYWHQIKKNTFFKARNKNAEGCTQNTGVLRPLLVKQMPRRSGCDHC